MLERKRMAAYESYEEFKEAVRSANPIEDVIEETGAEYRLNRISRNHWIVGSEHDSLNVCPAEGIYKWWAASEESGDVFKWYMNRHECDFMMALQRLAERAGLEMPRFSEKENQRFAAVQEKMDIWGAAQGLFAEFLKEDKAAWAYVTNGPTPSGKPRYFSEKTIKQAGLGFTGGTSAHRERMKKVFAEQGIDPACPAAVAVLGFQGDVGAWAERWNVTPKENWLRDSYISGLMSGKRLIYPHFGRGQVLYFSARNILGSENRKDGSIRKSYNLPKELVGGEGSQFYYNFLYSSISEEIVLVEGQGDAVALAEMGIPAAAMLGLNLKKMDKEIMALRWGKKRGKRFERSVYIGVDGDAPAWKAMIGNEEDWPIMTLLGPGARVINWQRDADRRKITVAAANDRERSVLVKDGNDYLAACKEWIKNENEAVGIDGKIDTKLYKETLQGIVKENIIDEAKLLIYQIADWAGNKKGADQERAQKIALMGVTQMDEFQFSLHRTAIADLLGMSVRELTNALKAANQIVEKAKTQGEPIYTWGGYYDGWMIEYLYDIEDHTAWLAWRDPDGKLGSGDRVEIEGRFFIPYPPDEAMQAGAVQYASNLHNTALNEKPVEIAELIQMIVWFLKDIYLWPSDQLVRLTAYWVLTTWIYDSFESLIYLRATGGAGSGKSELMKRIGLLCYRTMTANGSSSTSSLFRSVERYNGTVFIDEADLDFSDTENDMVKFYNLGAMKGNPIWKSESVIGPDGLSTFKPVAYRTFCPKLIAMRKDFKDDAVGTRSLTLKLVPRETAELIAAKVPLTLNREFRERAQKIRNLLVRWRLENWQPEIEVDPSFYDLQISARLNQVAGPMLAIAREDKEQQEAIRSMLRDYYAETILNQSMTLTARVVEAMWTIWQDPALKKLMVKEEIDEFLIKIGDITEITNKIISKMNDDEDDSEDSSGPSKDGKKMKSRRVGQILREDMQMRVSERRRDGFWVYWNEPRLIGLSTKYGVNRENFTPEPATTLQQGSLV
jgi:hypothetical protein